MDMSFARRGRKAAAVAFMPDYATLVAVAVARQSESATVRALADGPGASLPGGSLVGLFAASDGRAAGVTGSFNDAVAAAITHRKPT